MHPSFFDARRHALAIIAASVALGIVVDRSVGRGVPWLAVAGAAMGGWGLTVALRRGDALASVWLVLLYIALGGAWHHRCWRMFPITELGLAARDEPRPLCLEATVLSAPRTLAAEAEGWGPPMSDATLVRVRVRRVRDGPAWQRASGVAELRVRGPVPHVAAADHVRVYGTLRVPRRPDNPGAADEAEWRRMRRELMRLEASHPECLVVLRAAPWWSPRGWLAAARGHARAVLYHYMPPHYAGFAAALLLGVREDVSRSTIDAFFETGTIHLLAISGMHLSILLYALILALRLGWLARHHAIVLSCMLVVPYTVLTECQPPIVRAAVFVLVVSGGRLLTRRLLPWNAFGAAALCVVLMNPSHLFQVGVQLSFVAVWGLSYSAQWFTFRTTDPLDRLVEQTRARPVRWLRSFVRLMLRLWLTSLVVWLFTLPLIALHFCLISPAAIVLNPLLWAPTAGALFAGFAVIALGSLIPGIGLLLGALCTTSLWAAEHLVSWAATSAATHFWVPAPPSWWVAGAYGLAAAWAAVPAWRPRRRTTVLLGCGWTLLGAAWLAAPALMPGPPRLVCTFFAVGHGTCVVIELPDRSVLLYDAGRMGPPQPIVRCVSRYLWSQRTFRLRSIIISHADADHFNAVPDLVERLPTPRVFAPAHFLDHRSPLVQRLRAHLAARRVTIEAVALPRRWRLPGGTWIEVLHPPAQGAAGSDNAQSIVLRITYAGRTLLLPGDLEPPGLDRVLREPTAPYDVAMAPHHGSARSHPAGFAEWARPAHIIISSGRPAARAVLAAFSAPGRAIYETCRSGAVRVEISGNGTVHVRCWRSEPW